LWRNPISRARNIHCDPGFVDELASVAAVDLVLLMLRLATQPEAHLTLFPPRL